MSLANCFRWFLLLVSLPFSPVLAVNGNEYDVLTLRNGDIYNGTVAQQHFSLATSYGTLRIPYSQMVQLVLGGPEQPDRIVTRLGGRYSGRLQESRLTMLRVLDPTLPVAVEDISEIFFANRKFRLRHQRTPDSVITRNGDRFAAQVVTEALMMTGEDGVKLANPSGIHLLDVESLEDGENYLAQITSNDGQVFQGKFALDHVRVRTGFGMELDIPLGQLSAVGLRVNHSGNRPAFWFLQRLNPADFIQDRMRDGSLGPQMLALRGGSFSRGDLQGDGDFDERPVVEVNLEPFAIGIYEVTFDEYDQFCEETGHRKPDDQGWGRGSQPVVNVTWEDAQAYTEWLSRRTEQRYRLPTDAEWEYAARAGTGSRYWWGNELRPHSANCSGCGSIWDGEKSAPVGRFVANPFGLHDTAGNVFEWVADCWQEKFPARSEPDQSTDDACGKRVIRGGAWSFPPEEIRSANRWRDFPSRRSDDTGFRVVRELSLPVKP